MTFPKRYLVRFGPKHTQHLFTDLLVIGGGIAGLRAALAAPQALRVLVVTKDRLQISNSTYAQGGIAAVRSPEDRFEDHIEDTLTAGAGLCDRAVVEVVVREGPQQIDDLIRYGAKFDAEPGMEGGHSYHRIVHALGDATGFEVMRAIIERAAPPPTSPSGTAPLPSTCWWTTASVLDLTSPGRARRSCSSGPSRPSSRAAERAWFIARRPTRPWRPATAWRRRTGPGPSCATWNSCSSTRPSFTWPAQVVT